MTTNSKLDTGKLDRQSNSLAEKFVRAPATHVILTFLLLILFWELSVALFNIKTYLLPAPSKVWTDFLAHRQRVLDGLIITVLEVFVGYAVAVLVSIPLSLLIAFSRTAETTAYPLIVFFQIIPKIAIAPLFVIWLGLGFAPKILLVFLLCFFPIVVSAVAGFKSLDPEVMELARSTGATEWRTFRKIRLPQALPSIFTGLKVAAATAPTAAIVSEFVASDKGLGFLLLEFNGALEIPMVFGIVIVLSVVGLLLYYATELSERLIIPWHSSQRNRAGNA